MFLWYWQEMAKTANFKKHCSVLKLQQQSQRFESWLIWRHLELLEVTTNAVQVHRSHKANSYFINNKAFIKEGFHDSVGYCDQIFSCTWHESAAKWNWEEFINSVKSRLSPAALYPTAHYCCFLMFNYLLQYFKCTQGQINWKWHLISCSVDTFLMRWW